jgi:hypothetical protein
MNINSSSPTFGKISVRYGVNDTKAKAIVEEIYPALSAMDGVKVSPIHQKKIYNTIFPDIIDKRFKEFTIDSTSKNESRIYYIINKLKGLKVKLLP